MKLLSLDAETTGLNPQTDEIIELALVAVTGTEKKSVVYRFNPSVPITAGAFAVHGIAMEDLADEPPFSERAAEIAASLTWADALLGYNIRFDLDILTRQLHDAGRPVDLGETAFIDPYRIWTAMEPRTLSDAVQRFTGGELDGAHAALADAEATLRVLDAMKTAFGLQDLDAGALDRLSFPERRSAIGDSRHFRWENGAAVLAFGKHRGKPLYSIATETTYLDWMLSGTFPPETKAVIDVVRSAGARSSDELHRVLARHFGEPPEPDTE